MSTSKLSAIDVGKSRREVPEAPVTDSEMTRLRGLIGSMQYAVSHTRPDLASRLGEIQVQLSQPTVLIRLAYTAKQPVDKFNTAE